MSWLIDTNVLSELRKGPRADAGVTQWFADVADDAIFTSVLVLGELRRGVELVRRRDEVAATSLERWLDEMVGRFPERVLPLMMPWPIAGAGSTCRIRCRQSTDC